MVFRVSRIWMVVPFTSAANCREMVAVPERVCRKLSAVRSPVSRLRAGPERVRRISPGFTSSPSRTRHSILTVGSSWANTSSTQAVPHITACSRVMTLASALFSSGIRRAVMSPSPISSFKACLTVAEIWLSGKLFDIGYPAAIRAYYSSHLWGDRLGQNKLRQLLVATSVTCFSILDKVRIVWPVLGTGWRFTYPWC